MTIQPHQPRTYRRLHTATGLAAFRITVQETDLWISADAELTDQAREAVLATRGQIESYIEQFPRFATALTPWQAAAPLPPVVRQMARASHAVGVGPMAAVAGAVAEAVGRKLLTCSSQVIVENGGDLFVCAKKPVTIAVMAGKSPLSMRLGLRLTPGRMPCGICTSSGSVGHSLSLGTADAVCVLSKSCPLADAAATWIGNQVSAEKDVETAARMAGRIEGIDGAVVIKGSQIALWGELEVVGLDKKGVEF